MARNLNNTMASSCAKHAHVNKRVAVSCSGAASRLFAGVLATLVVVGCVGIGFASAGNDTSSTDKVNDIPVASEQISFSDKYSKSSSEAFILETSAHRDVSGGFAEIEAEEIAAAEAAAEAARLHEADCIKQGKEAQAASASNGGMNVYDVDFGVGREAFVNEWTTRINKYLEGSNLAGYGATFAEAAWEYGVDPRWSPAISNTESGKAAHCSAWHNAWGWTGGAWSNWVSAIYDHVKGLSEIYGFTISFANAQQYCPPNFNNWYRDTLYEMSLI